MKNSANILTVIGFVFAGVVFCFVTGDVNASLVAQYTFEGNAVDVSGNGHDGIIFGDAQIVDDADRGRVLRNVSGRMDIHTTKPIPAFAANSSVTIAAWVKREVRESGDYNYILQLGRNGDSAIVTMNILPDGRVRSYIETDMPGMNTDQVAVTSTKTVETDSAFASWHHLAVVHDRSTDKATVYIDGIAGGQTDISSLNDAYSFTWTSAMIGSDSDGTPVYKGLIDDVRIYNHALSTADIQTVMNAKQVVVSKATLEIEEGKSGSFDVSIGSDPGKEVQVTITPADDLLSLTVGQASYQPGEPAVFVLNSDSLNKTVTAATADDDEGIGNRKSSISIRVNDAEYNPLSDIEVTIIEDDPVCGDWGYSAMDFNRDCYVDFYDLVIFAEQWLTCTHPEDIQCYSVKEFSLIALPDTQVYSESYPQHFIAQTQWIVDNAEALNIKYVLHLGDITDNNNSAQWINAKAALSILDGKVPYALAPGNHDYGPGGNCSIRDSIFLNDADNAVPYFGVGTPYATQPSLGGFYVEPDGTVRTDNSWHTFTGLGEDFLVLALEFGPRDEVVAWAEDVVADHPDHRAILITHAYMYYDETRYDWASKGSSQSWNPHGYGVASKPGGVNDGEELWQNLVKKYGNFIMTINGHVLNDGAARLTSVGDEGNSVHQILNNYQGGVIGSVEGGMGFLRIFTFKPDRKTVEVKTYSPVLDEYKTDDAQQFTLELLPKL